MLLSLDELQKSEPWINVRLVMFQWSYYKRYMYYHEELTEDDQNVLEGAWGHFPTVVESDLGASQGSSLDSQLHPKHCGHHISL